MCCIFEDSIFVATVCKISRFYLGNKKIVWTLNVSRKSRHYIWNNILISWKSKYCFPCNRNTGKHRFLIARNKKHSLKRWIREKMEWSLHICFHSMPLERVKPILITDNYVNNWLSRQTLLWYVTGFLIWDFSLVACGKFTTCKCHIST